MRKRGVYAMLTILGLCSAVVAGFLLINMHGSAQAVPMELTVPVQLSSNQGTVLGNYGQTAWTKQTFMQFRGIPFAEAPVGPLRFLPPVTRKPFAGIYEALNYGQRCPVLTHLNSDLTDHQLEDCLNLCVYTKNLTASQPVMFYIYGGGYYNGSASDHPPHYLLERDVVLVVPHYRVGALGWLSTQSNGLPGNAPVADILLALNWVQLHIQKFGGDPQKVTIIGQSAGAGVASALLLSPQTPDHLFQRAIVQSGSILAQWAINKDPQGQALRICQKIGCNECDNHNKLLTCVQQASVKDILLATTSETFSPIVGDLQGILQMHPNELLKQYQKQIPLMTGFTQHDGSFVLASYYDALASKLNVSSLSVRTFSQGIINMLNDTTGTTDQLIYRLLFTPDLLQSHAHKSALAAYFDLTSDTFIKTPIISLATKLLEKQPTTPIYVYSFEYEGDYTRFGYEFGNDHYPFNGGIHHSNDNIYIFTTHSLQGADIQMSRHMVDLWTSFASSGIPQNLKALTSSSGPYNRIGLEILWDDDLLQSLTATLDDPNNKRLDRPNIEF